MSTQEEQREVLQKVADELTRRHLATPAIFMLESVKPLTFIASQALVVFEPLLQALLSINQYRVFCDAIENRGNVEWLIAQLEQERS